MRNNIKSIFMASHTILFIALVSCGGNNSDTDSIDFSDALAAADVFQKTAEEMENISPSPYESVCMPLLETQGDIMESIEETLITESQRSELVDIYKRCYDSIQQEISITKVEFKDLPKTSECLTSAQEFSKSFSDFENSIDTLSKMPLTKTEDNNAVKSLAGMLPLSIALTGGKAMLNRMTNCTFEKSKFNSEAISKK